MDNMKLAAPQKRYKPDEYPNYTLGWSSRSVPAIMEYTSGPNLMSFVPIIQTVAESIKFNLPAEKLAKILDCARVISANTNQNYPGSAIKAVEMDGRIAYQSCKFVTQNVRNKLRIRIREVEYLYRYFPDIMFDLSDYTVNHPCDNTIPINKCVTCAKVSTRILAQHETENQSFIMMSLQQLHNANKSNYEDRNRDYKLVCLHSLYVANSIVAGITFSGMTERHNLSRLIPNRIPELSIELAKYVKPLTVGDEIKMLDCILNLALK